MATDASVRRGPAPVDPTAVLVLLSRTPTVAWIVAIAVLLRLLLGPGSVGYDAAWSLLWGDQIASGLTPDMRTDIAPTPHPLANAVAVCLAPLGADVATRVVMGLSWVALAALGIGLARLGAALFSWPVGLLAAAILMTRPLLSTLTAQALVDVPFLALIVWAACLEARRPRHGAAVPVLLLLAGLLRPEAWLLAAAYGLWAIPAQPWRERARTAAVLSAAPMLWAVADWLATGNPLHSLEGTQALAEELGRPRGGGSALRTAPNYLASTLSLVVAVVGSFGALMAAGRRPQAARLPLALLLLGLIAYLMFGVVGLPLRIRYLLVPSAMLVLFAAVAALGWTNLGRDHPRRRAWQTVGLVCAAVLALATPKEVQTLGDVRAHMALRHAVQEELVAALGRPEVKSAIRRCRAVWVPHYRARPIVGLEIGGGVERVSARPSAAGGPAVLFAYAEPAGAANFSGMLPAPASGPATLPPDSRRLHWGPRWLVAASGC